ncbi:amino acid permease [Lacipirellula limnantheis]|uniref:Putative amino acid permease YhdG n=1 Tax=Lacipirellula limnantheis TaxID=2528024 RepID=A0A517U3W0_9BACT|nr:amino acid permease [Lacipirellula limnantheis]QDT75309.1 putative amino acid permease YhdG [Lacipirellula limnantheis]
MMRWGQLFKRKDLQHLIQELANENRLRRVLGPISLTALGVGCIIGAGIFVMTGRAAAEDAGPAITISYAVAALGCVFAALCYAEFAAMAPVAGSAYTYAYATLGELLAWIIGWDLILEYAMACACVAAGWANYLNEFLRTCFGVEIPERFCSDPFSTPGALFNLPAVGIMLVVTVILIVGIRESAVANAALTLVKLVVVLFVIGLGFTLINQDQNNWTDVPYGKRLSTAELTVSKVVADKVRGNRPAKDLTKAELAQIDVDAAYVRAKLALDKAEAMKIEMVKAGDMPAEQADAELSAAQATLAAAQAKVTDPARFDEIIADINAAAREATAEKWGLLGAIISPERLKPLDDAFRTNYTPYGISGIMLGAAIVFFAFIGFDSISTHAEEAINPQRDIPIAILASLGICTILYVLVAAVITGMEPYYQIDTKAAIAAAFRKQAEAKGSGVLRISSVLIATGALAGLTSVLLVTFLSQARIFLAMARDKLLPPSIFAAVHPRFKTPHISTALTGLVICVTAAFTPIADLEKMVNIGTLFAFVIVCVTVLILRFQDPTMARPFRCPLIYFVAPAGILVNVSMMLFLPVSTWLRLVIWMGLGLVIYFAYGYRHSILGKELVRDLAKEGIGPTDGPLRS